MNRGSYVFWIVLILVIGLLIVGLGSADFKPLCSEALQKQGFSNVQFGSHLFFTCGRDMTCREFTATASGGRQVQGAATKAYYSNRCFITIEQ